jgi:sulfide:quinone oxidoreductase
MLEATQMGGTMDAAKRKKVLIAGGGVAALEAALALRELAADRVDVELLAPEPHFWYRPLSVAAPFALGEVNRFELDGLARDLGASFTLGALTGIDEWRHIAHTSKNRQIPYDMLLVACGALPLPSIPGALTFRGPADIELVQHLLEEVARGDVGSIAFVIPWGAVWPLPAYELALLTAAHVRVRGVADGIELTLVTPESAPLQLFGSPASEAACAVLEESGVEIRVGAYAGKFADGQLELIPDGTVIADRVVALPRLQGSPIDGLPQTVDGFIPVDSHCRVRGVTDVFAAGDITSFTVKQGGIATQQADVAAAAIAAEAGADVAPTRFRPVLRGLLLTGREPRYLRRELTIAPEEEPSASYEPLWWPPAKIVGLYLAPFLAARAGAELPPSPGEALSGGVALEVELEDEALDTSTWRRFVSDHDVDDAGVGEIMSPDTVVVVPEDTLGEVAERLLATGATAAAVAEYGRLIGILTAGDLVRASAMRVHPSEGRARQWMTAEPVTVSPKTPVLAAARLANEYGVRHLPVVDGGRPVGMLYMDDALRQASVPIGLGF